MQVILFGEIHKLFDNFMRMDFRVDGSNVIFLILKFSVFEVQDSRVEFDDLYSVGQVDDHFEPLPFWQDPSGEFLSVDCVDVAHAAVDYQNGGVDLKICLLWKGTM